MKTSIAWAVAILSAFPSSAAPTQYTIAEIEARPFGVCCMELRSINGSGQVAGGRPASVWDKGTWTALAAVKGVPADANDALAINGAGQVVGWSYLTSDPWNTTRAVLWTSGALTNLGDPFPDYGDYSVANAINANGDVAGNDHLVSPGDDYATLWPRGDPSAKIHLPFLANALSGHAFANAINDLGQVAGASSAVVPCGQGTCRAQPAALWNTAAGTVTSLGLLGQGDSAAATAVNNSGVVAGYSYTFFGSNPHAFVWQNGAMQDLGALPGADQSIAYGINSAGDIVGASWPAGYPQRAFIYSAGTMSDLTSLVVPTCGWALNTATAINDRGQIVGQGHHTAGGINEPLRDYILTPVTGPVDTTKPTVSIGSAPPAVTAQNTAAFAFTASDACSGSWQLAITCSLDGLAPAPCASSTASYTGLAAGSHSFTATATNPAGASASVTYPWLIQFSAASTSTSVASATNPAVYGQSVSFVASVTSAQATPAGTVQFAIDSAPLGTPVALDGTGTAYSTTTNALAAGSHLVTAAYAGNGEFAASTGSLAFAVAPAPLIISASNLSKTYGQTLTFAGTEFTVSGLVAADAVTAVTLASDGAAPGAPAGQYPIVPGAAIGSGLANYAITYQPGILIVTRAQPALAYTGALWGTYHQPTIPMAALTDPGGTPIAGRSIAFTLGADSCGAVTDAAGNAACTIVISSQAGTSTVAASFAGDSNYLPSSDPHSFVVLQDPTTTVYTGAVSGSYLGSYTLSATVVETSTGQAAGEGGLVHFSLGEPELQGCSAGTNATGIAACTITLAEPAGTYPVVATFAGSTDFAPSSTATSFTVSADTTSLVYTGPTLIERGQPLTMSAVFSDTFTQQPIAGQTIAFGLGSEGCAAVTDANGSASCTVAAVAQADGPASIAASFAGNGDYLPASATANALVFEFLASGTFVIADTQAAAGSQVLFWGAQWSKANSPSGGAAPAGFKGFADQPSRVACGNGFTSRPGNSSHPPATVPRFMATLVSSSISASGSTIAGDGVKIVILQTAADYAPNPGHAGTATVAAVLCGGSQSLASAH